MVDDIEKPDQQVVLVRHAQTEWSRSGRHTGTTDLPLTDEGRAATRLLGDRLAGRRFARVLSSPLKRAAETCRIAGFTDEVEIRGDLVEWDYGAYEGRTTADFRRWAGSAACESWRPGTTAPTSGRVRSERHVAVGGPHPHR